MIRRRGDDVIAELVAAAFKDDERRNRLSGSIVEQDSTGGENFCGQRKRNGGDATIEEKFFVLLAGGRLHRERSRGGFARGVVAAGSFLSSKVRTGIGCDGNGIPSNAAVGMWLVESIGGDGSGR